MNEKAILLAISELESWESRETKLKDKMKLMSREERKLSSRELERIKEQVYHYRKLIKEMKREVAPPSTGGFLEHL